jgi:hypothetical protein
MIDTPEYRKYLEKQLQHLENDNMDEYALSLGTQEGSRSPVFSSGIYEPVLTFVDELPDPTNPSHYQNADKKFEHRFVAKAWGLEYYLSAATKYIARSGKKTSVGMTDIAKEIEDLEKSIVYIQFRIDELTGE